MIDSDQLTLKMQESIIEISQKRLGKKLLEVIIEKIRNTPRGYVGLEMIIDTVNSIETSVLEEYLQSL